MPIKPKTLSGFQDLLPAQSYQKTLILEKIKEHFHSFGFSPIETPHLEYTETLISEEASEVGKQLYRFEDNGKRDVCLRFDLTIPLARYVVQYQNDLVFPFKRYAIGSCFRGERPQFGRFREFTQCDFDILGADSIQAESEITQVIVRGFQKLGFEKFVTKINNRKILSGFAKHIGFEQQAIDLIRVVDKKDKLSAEKFNEELANIGCNADQIKQVEDLFALSTAERDPLKLIESLRTMGVEDELFFAGLKEAKELFTYLADFDFADHIRFDLSLARGLGYYTGTVFETILSDVPEIGSVSGGGRYQDLTKNFGKQEISGVGASFGISRIMLALEQLEKLNNKSTPAKILCLNLDKDLVKDVDHYAVQLREQGIATEVYPGIAKFAKQLQYADKKGIPFVLVFGSDEKENNNFQLKNLESGEQQSFSSVAEALPTILSE